MGQRLMFINNKPMICNYIETDVNGRSDVDDNFMKVYIEKKDKNPS